MKKINQIICLTAFLLGFAACSKDFLEKRPRDLVSELDAYGTEDGLMALTVTLYNDMQTEDLNFTVATEAGFPATTTDEAVRSYPWGSINNPVMGNWYGGVWQYTQIRRVNDFISKMPNATVKEEIKKRYLAEGRFIRAFHYFSMVKRYGGVPLLKEAQQISENIDDLAVQRSKEHEIYDFIASELDLAAQDLPEAYDKPGDGPNRYRITKYAALALKSRAMLYAASSAKYAPVQLDGLVGIPDNMANGYWQAAYDAAKEIMNSGVHSLYNGDPDKAANFQKLFLTLENPEAIFTKVFSSPDKGHSFDFYNAPQSFKVDYGCATNPTLELIEAFEYTDGSPGNLKVNDAGGNPIVYANPRDIFKDKDPRMFGSILTPFDNWQGGVLEVRRGVINAGVKYTAENLSDGYPETDSPFKRVGKDGPLTTNDPTKTGFYVKKFMDPVNRVNQGRSTTPWMILRYGEVLLNFAEAAFELNRPDEALDAINQIRERAGIADKSSINLEAIRHERRVELAFENHRYWDLRRWRTASTVLSNTQFHALYPWIMWQNGVNPADMSYTFEIANAPKATRTFPEQLYYEPVPQGNPVYVQNPLY